MDRNTEILKLMHNNSYVTKTFQRVNTSSKTIFSQYFISFGMFLMAGIFAAQTVYYLTVGHYMSADNKISWIVLFLVCVAGMTDLITGVLESQGKRKFFYAGTASNVIWIVVSVTTGLWAGILKNIVMWVARFNQYKSWGKGSSETTSHPVYDNARQMSRNSFGGLIVLMLVLAVAFGYGEHMLNVTLAAAKPAQYAIDSAWREISTTTFDSLAFIFTSTAIILSAKYYREARGILTCSLTFAVLAFGFSGLYIAIPLMAMSFAPVIISAYTWYSYTWVKDDKFEKVFTPEGIEELERKIGPLQDDFDKFNPTDLADRARAKEMLMSIFKDKGLKKKGLFKSGDKTNSNDSSKFILSLKNRLGLKQRGSIPDDVSKDKLEKSKIEETKIEQTLDEKIHQTFIDPDSI